MQITLVFKLVLILYIASFSSLQANNLDTLADISAQDCQGCHQTIYQQWQSSMHAQSTALSDPIHGKLYRGLVGDPKQQDLKHKGKYPLCLQCHAPMAALDGKTDLTAKVTYNEGVNCLTCHRISENKSGQKTNAKLRLGTQAYKFSSNSLQSAGKKTTEHPVFALNANPDVFESNAVCMGCHDRRYNANKIALCQTGSEIAQVENTPLCISCHMPKKDGKADHRFLGGHSAEMPRQAVMMDMQLDKQGEILQVKIKLSNLLPHNLPTGAPFRNLFVKLTAYGDQERVVWKNSQTHPVKDDKQAMLMYRLGNAKSKPTSPAKATQVLGDSRLKPYETRVLDYKLKAKDVARVKAELFYDLLLPGMKKKFAALQDKSLLQAKRIAVAEQKLR